MQFNTLFFLLCLSCLCLALAQVSYDDCCLKYVQPLRQRIKKHAVKYKYQKTDGGCNIPAVIFTLKKGRKFCTDPNEKWVTDLMERIDQKEMKNQSGWMGHHRHSNRG